MLEITVRLNPDLKEYFYARASQTPEWIKEKWFPVLELFVTRLNNELRMANRSADVNKITYAQGRLDGVQAMLELLGGIKLSEAKNPTGTGLASRILSFGRK